MRENGIYYDICVWVWALSGIKLANTSAFSCAHTPERRVYFMFCFVIKECCIIATVLFYNLSDTNFSERTYFKTSQKKWWSTTCINWCMICSLVLLQAIRTISKTMIFSPSRAVRTKKTWAHYFVLFILNGCTEGNRNHHSTLIKYWAKNVIISFHGDSILLVLTHTRTHLLKTKSNFNTIISITWTWKDEIHIDDDETYFCDDISRIAH